MLNTPQTSAGAPSGTEAIAVSSDGGAEAVATPARVVVLDEPRRAREIYGTALSRLQATVLSGWGLSEEQVMELRPSAIVLSSEWTHEWRLIAAAARKERIPVVYVMDGVLEWSYVWNNLTFIRPWGTMLQPLIASDVCVIGQHQARILASMGLAARVHVTGIPRFDEVTTERVTDRNSKPRIVVATPRTAGHNCEQHVMVLRALRDLQQWFSARADIEVIWRIAADLAEDIGVAPDISGSMGDVLRRANALISFTSTCLLEGMYVGLPSAQIDYRAVPTYVATAWEIRCSEHIPGVVHELLYPSAEKLAWQDACCSDELEAGGAADRLAAAIRTAMHDAAGTAAGGAEQPMRRNGRLDYRQIHSELSAFSIGEQSILQYELAAAHGLLRQSKHEKGLLQRETVEIIESLGSSDIRNMRVCSFVEQIATARYGTDGAPNPKVVFYALNSRAVRCLEMSGNSEITFAIPTGRSGKLSMAVALHPDAWDIRTPIDCRVAARADGVALLEAKLSIPSPQRERRWNWFEFHVKDTAAGTHAFTLQVKVAARNRQIAVLWRTPTFVWNDQQFAASDGYIPKIARGIDYYVPGRSIA